MPFNGSGTFNLVAGNPFVTGTVISSTVMNNTMSDFATGFTNCVTRNGQSSALSNLPMGGYKHTGATGATATGEYLTYGQTSGSLSSATIGTLSVTGNANINGNTTIGDAGSDTLIVNAATTISGTAAMNGSVTIGDASTDTLTINPNAVAWQNNPTHSGNHLFSSNLRANGVFTVGGSSVFPVSTFSPGVSFGGASVGVAYTIDTRGRYVLVGDMVLFWIQLNLSSKGSSVGAARITGLPFALSSTTTGIDQVPYSVSVSNGNLSGLTGAVSAFSTSGSTSISLEQWGASGTSSLTNTNFLNSTSMFVFGVYRV